MIVKELIEKLNQVPEDSTVKTWDGYSDNETENVVVSITNDGDVFIMNVAIGEQI